jgi:hypothetical protein
MTAITEGFGALGISINNNHILKMKELVVRFTIRGSNPLTLHGNTLGVHPIVFKDSDRDALFDIFGVDYAHFKNTIKGIHTIDKTRNVQSDPFNLLCFWLIYLAPIFIKNERIRHGFMMDVLRYFNFKIFTSVVNNSFPHGANEGVMEATVMSLNKKWDIIKYKTWSGLIESHCEKFLDQHDRRLSTPVFELSSDEKFLNVVAEMQGMLRQKIVTFAQNYYATHAEGTSLKSKSSVGTGEDGEKIVAQQASVIESASAAMISELLNLSMFINDSRIDDVSRQVSSISSRMLKSALMELNRIAVIQASSKKFDLTEKAPVGINYIGVRVLLLVIIKTMLRHCQQKKVNPANHAAVFSTMQAAYTSSRIMDQDIADIKRSVGLIIDHLGITSNEASKASLRLGVIYYIIYRTLEKMK